MPVRTYQDAVEHLADVFDHDRSARMQRNMRRAVEEAYRELPQQGYWAYYRRRAILNTVPCQTTGSVTYTNSTRTITLTGATFPTNVAEYRLILGNAHYDIESYTDSTHVVLPALSNPGADVAAGTGYQIYKNEYVLPVDFRRVLGLYDITQRRLIEIVEDSTEQMLQVAALWSPGVPIYAAIRNTGKNIDRLSLIFSAMPPVDSRGYDIMYDARPRPFTISEKYADGTVSVSAASTALAGTGTVFPASCAGAVIRLSANASDEPTAPFGAKIKNLPVDNPYDFQTTIQTYTDGATLVLKDAPTNAYSGVKYSISDPVDVEDGAMYTAFLRMMEVAYARLINHKDRGQREVSARQALILAKESDKRSIDKRQLPIVTQQWYTLSSMQG